MNDPEIHSVSWEWDQTGPSEHWKRAHNYQHHTYTNVVGMDEDLGFGILRMTRDEPWKPINLFQPIANVILAATFEWGIALHDLTAAAELEGRGKGAAELAGEQRLRAQDLSSGGQGLHLVPGADGAGVEVDHVGQCDREPRAQPVGRTSSSSVATSRTVPRSSRLPNSSRRLVTSGTCARCSVSANFNSGKLMGLMSGNLSYQIEHHVFPDLPSNRYPEIAVKMRALCEKFDLPYTTGSLFKQYLLALRTIHKLALPDKWLTATSDNAPETSSELRFRDSGFRDAAMAMVEDLRTDPITGKRLGLLTALKSQARSRMPKRRK